jgi:hypothetical protein
MTEEQGDKLRKNHRWERVFFNGARGFDSRRNRLRESGKTILGIEIEYILFLKLLFFFGNDHGTKNLFLMEAE